MSGVRTILGAVEVWLAISKAVLLVFDLTNHEALATMQPPEPPSLRIGAGNGGGRDLALRYNQTLFMHQVTQNLYIDAVVLD